MPDTGNGQPHELSRDEVVAKILAGVVAAAHLDGAVVKHVDLIEGTAVAHYGDTICTVTVDVS